MDPFISFYSHLYSAGSHIILCAEQWSFAIYWETNPPSPIINMSFFSPDCTLAFIDILMDATSHIYILDTIFISFQWALSFSQKNTRSHITAQRSFSLLLLALHRYFMFTAQYKTSEEVLHMLWQNSVNVRDEKWLSNIDSKIFKFSSSLFKLVFFLMLSHIDKASQTAELNDTRATYTVTKYETLFFYILSSSALYKTNSHFPH